MLSGWVGGVPARFVWSPDAMAARSERTEQHHTCLLPSPEHPLRWKQVDGLSEQRSLIRVSGFAPPI